MPDWLKKEHIKEEQPIGNSDCELTWKFEHMEDNYITVKTVFEELCDKYQIPRPRNIRRALNTDPCDYTDPPHEVRINTDPDKNDCEPYYQGRHLFGHYISDLAQVSDANSDLVADLIAELVNNAET